MESTSVTYKVLDKNDTALLKELVTLYALVFETENFTPASDAYFETLLHQESVIFCVALQGQKVIGGLTAYVLPSAYEAVSQVYLYDLAVVSHKQRQGVGSALLTLLKKHCVAAAYSEMYVQANIEDEHAIDFYRATGGHPESVVHFSYPYL